MLGFCHSKTKFMKRVLFIYAGILLWKEVLKQSLSEASGEDTGSASDKLEEQMVALQRLSLLMDDCGELAGPQIGSVEVIRHVDLDFPDGFFDSLGLENPKVASDARVAAVKVYNRHVLLLANIIEEHGWEFAVSLASNLRATVGRERTSMMELLANKDLDEAGRLRLSGELRFRAARLFLMTVDLLADLHEMKDKQV
jgi:hypothetical protein